MFNYLDPTPIIIQFEININIISIKYNILKAWKFWIWEMMKRYKYGKRCKYIRIRVYLLCIINIILYDMYKFSKKKWLDNKSNGSANPLEFKYGMIFEKSNLNS